MDEVDRDELDRCGDPADATRLPQISKPCAGDCNRNCAVAVDELIRGVRVALSLSPLDACVAVDADLDGVAKIPELIESVRNSLGTCL